MSNTPVSFLLLVAVAFVSTRTPPPPPHPPPRSARQGSVLKTLWAAVEFLLDPPTSKEEVAVLVLAHAAFTSASGSFDPDPLRIGAAFGFVASIPLGFILGILSSLSCILQLVCDNVLNGLCLAFTAGVTKDAAVAFLLWATSLQVVHDIFPDLVKRLLNIADLQHKLLGQQSEHAQISRLVRSRRDILQHQHTTAGQLRRQRAWQRRTLLHLDNTYAEVASRLDDINLEEAAARDDNQMLVSQLKQLHDACDDVADHILGLGERLGLQDIDIDFNLGPLERTVDEQCRAYSDLKSRLKTTRKNIAQLEQQNQLAEADLYDQLSARRVLQADHSELCRDAAALQDSLIHAYESGACLLLDACDQRRTYNITMSDLGHDISSLDDTLAFWTQQQSDVQDDLAFSTLEHRMHMECCEAEDSDGGLAERLALVSRGLSEVEARAKDEKYEANQDQMSQGIDDQLSESLVDIIADQDKRIAALEAALLAREVVATEVDDNRDGEG